MTETESRWAARVQAWRSSGESAADYARGRGFEASTLRWWSSRIGRGAVASDVVSKARTPPRVRMVRLEAPSTRRAPRALTVRVGVAQVDVQPGFDRALLRELVEALGGRS